MAAEDETALSRGRPVERLIFGSGEDADIDELFSRFAERELASTVEATLFKRTSVGVLAGVLLEDGRRVVIKAHQPGQPVEVLQTVFDTQRYLAHHGFPCPRPIIPPAPLGNGFATVEELVDAGSFADPHEPAVYQAMASALARLIDLTRPLGALESLAGAWGLWKPGGLWPPTAHSPIFDFAATSDGAGWIDELGSAAKSQVLLDDEQLVVHSDWSGKHFRFNDLGEITVVYDWDSLALRTEVQAVGIAAGTFTSNFELDIVYAPAPQEVASFIESYSQARELPMGSEDVLAARAAAAYVIAYTARCEHALGKRGDFTAALSHFGREYLASAP